MARNKKPAVTIEEPTYPSVEDAGIDRRRFLAILAGGAAATAIFTGCNNEEHERLPGQEPVPRLPGVMPNPDPPPEVIPRAFAIPGIVLPGLVDLSNDPNAPPPNVTGMQVSLSDRTSTAFTLFFSWETDADRELIVRRADLLMATASNYLSSSCNHHSVTDPIGINEIRNALRALLLDKLGRPGRIYFLDIQFGRVQRAEQVRGRIRRPMPVPKPRLKGKPSIPLDYKNPFKDN
jgi:hypothetical protein